FGVLLLAGSALWRIWGNAPDGSAISLTNPLHLTTALGVEEASAWSPHGSMIAFSANGRGNPVSFRWDIGVIDAAGGTPVNRTADFGGRNQFPSWSPDGTQIAFWSD